MINTKVNICGLEFKNPVIGASGTVGFGREYSEYFDLNRLGGISSKGLTLNEKQGNKGVRTYETTGGLLNSIGLQNPGIDNFIRDELPTMKTYDMVVMANVGGGTEEDYLEALERLNSTDVDIIELNISCPNVKKGGMAFGIREEDAYNIVKKCRQVCKKPLIVKLSPNAENIVRMAKKCEEAGADGLSLVNTFSGMAVDINMKKPVFDNIIAGLSGPCIKPIALRMVYEVSKAVNIPVIGIGGIISAEDAIEFIMAGAHAVQVGSGNYLKPDLMIDIIEGIEEYMKSHNIANLEEIRGIIWRDKI